MSSHPHCQLKLPIHLSLPISIFPFPVSRGMARIRCAPLLVWREGIDESMAEATRDWLSTALVKRGSLDVDGQAAPETRKFENGQNNACIFVSASVLLKSTR